MIFKEKPLQSRAECPDRIDEEILNGLQHKREHAGGKCGDVLPRRSTEIYPGNSGPEPGRPNMHWGQKSMMNVKGSKEDSYRVTGARRGLRKMRLPCFSDKGHRKY